MEGFKIISFVLLFGNASLAQVKTAEYFPESSVRVGDCPDDWIDADILGCYKFLDAKINHTWVEAQYDCEQIGGYLAEPTTHRLSSFLHSLANFDDEYDGIKHWYIGLTDIGLEGSWTWVHNRELLTEESWGSERPSSEYGNRADCAVMVLQSSAWWWEDWDCSLEQIQETPVAPVCQRQFKSSNSTTTQKPMTTSQMSHPCPAGWSEFQGSCYRLEGGVELKWMYAVSECGKQGGFPVIIHSKEEEDFVKNLSDGENFWVGGIYSSSGPIWIDGSNFDYGNFNSNSDTDECIYYYFSNSQFNTAPCTYSAAIICEKYI